MRVNTVLGSTAPPLSVKLMQVFSSGSKDASIIDQVMLSFFPTIFIISSWGGIILFFTISSSPSDSDCRAA